MNYRYAALLFLAGAFALSTSAQAGTLTSEFELVPGGPHLVRGRDDQQPQRDRRNHQGSI